MFYLFFFLPEKIIPLPQAAVMRGELSSVWRCPRQEQLELDSILIWFLLSVPVLRAYVCCSPSPLGGLGLLEWDLHSATWLPTFHCQPKAQQMLVGKSTLFALEVPPPQHTHLSLRLAQAGALCRFLPCGETRALSQDPWLFPPKIVRWHQEVNVQYLSPLRGGGVPLHREC